MYRYKILDCSNNKKYQSSVIITLNSKLSTLNFLYQLSTLNFIVLPNGRRIRLFLPTS